MRIHSTSLCSSHLWRRLSAVSRAPLRRRTLNTSTSYRRGSVCWDFTWIKLLSLVCLFRFLTGLGIKESDTRKTLVSSKRKPTCTLRELPWVRLMHPHMEAKQIHPQLQTLQVRQEVPGSAQLLDMFLLSVHHYNVTAIADNQLNVFKWWCWWFLRNERIRNNKKRQYL